MGPTPLGSRPTSVPASSRAACGARSMSRYPAAMPRPSPPGRSAPSSFTYNVVSYVPWRQSAGPPATGDRADAPDRSGGSGGRPPPRTPAAARTAHQPGRGPGRGGLAGHRVAGARRQMARTGLRAHRRRVRDSGAGARLPAQPRRPQPPARPHPDRPAGGARADQRVLRPGLHGRRGRRRRAWLRGRALPLPRGVGTRPGPVRLGAGGARRGDRLLDGRRRPGAFRATDLPLVMLDSDPADPGAAAP